MRNIIFEGLKYAMPLMVLDTFMVKKYCQISWEDWSIQRRNWIQYNRLLPVDPPTVFQILWHLVVSFILYDIFFYAVHLIVHKNLWLYKNVHAVHHEHVVMHSRITNQLNVAEQIILVLSANQALRIIDAHPLTRAFFVPLFLGWLVENHCGYDFPWTLDKIIPFKLVGGSRYHYDHHMKGNRNYQPFFTYIDNMFHRKKKSQ
jgi:cholesterol 25-hydroxylase